MRQDEILGASPSEDRAQAAYEELGDCSREHEAMLDEITGKMAGALAMAAAENAGLAGDTYRGSCWRDGARYAYEAALRQAARGMGCKQLDALTLALLLQETSPGYGE